MAQYDVAKLIYESNSGLTVSDLKTRLNLTGGTIRYNLDHLMRKGYIVQKEKTYHIASDIGASDIEDLKPLNIEDFE